MRKILQFAEGLGLLVDLADPIKFLKLDLSFRFGEESEYGSLYQPLIADWSIKDSEPSYTDLTMTGYVFVTSSGTSQSTYIHIFHLLLWCAASSELAPQSSSNSNQYHLKVLNSYTIHEKQSKRTRKKQSWKWLVAKNVSHELVKRGNPYIWVDQRPHCCRSAADLNKSHNPKGIHHPHETINGCTWKSYSQQWPLPSPLFTKQHPMFSKYRSMFLPLMRSENQWRQHATFSVPPDESNQQNEHSEISSTAFQKRNQ